MNEVTFNIADYRPLSRVRTHYESPAMRPRSSFVVLSSNAEPRSYERAWFEPHPAVVEIRPVREGHRPAARRGKILRFSNPASHRVYTMPAPESRSREDDDPGPLVA